MRVSPLSGALALALLPISFRTIQAQPVAGAFAPRNFDPVAGTMTLLRNGQVLFAGGGTTGAEIYDPPSATLSPLPINDLRPRGASLRPASYTCHGLLATDASGNLYISDTYNSLE